MAMLNLLPHFIVDRFKCNQNQGQFQAVGMFVDISGFTSMTEILMQGGEEGAEILSNILNLVFEPTVNAVYRGGGFISKYAGDAFTAFFPVTPDQTPTSLTLSTLLCAEKVQHIFQTFGFQETKFGNFKLEVKIGLSFGDCDWAIVGDESKAFFFRGELIHGITASEDRATEGMVVFDEKMVSYIDKEIVSFEPLSSGFYVFRSLNRKLLKHYQLPKVLPRSRLSKSVARQFLPLSVIDYNKAGEFRNVASVFISFEGLSTLEELHLWVSAVLEGVNKFSGYFPDLEYSDKGWVILCTFGAPIAHENNISRALEFILDLQERVRAIKTLEPLRFRVGITYGKVYAGIIGGKKRCEYATIGDVVNLAARFMMKADFGQIWVSERVSDAVKHYFEIEYLDRYRFKGKSEPIPVYRLKGKRSSVQVTFAGRFVGQRSQLQKAKKVLRALSEHQFGGALYIYGEAGMGKSRFIHELREQFQDYQWAYLRCDNMLQKSFNPFTSYLAELFDLNQQSRRQNQARFKTIYRDLIQSASDHPEIVTELHRLESLIEGFLGIHDPKADSLYNQLDTKLRYVNTLYALKEIFKALSLKAPLALVVEDIKWIDPDSVRVLQTLCRNIDDFPILLILTSRYNDDQSKPSLNLDCQEDQIELTPLSGEEIETYAKSLLNGDISSKLAQNLKQNTQGNPLFIEQNILYFRESKAIIPHTVTDETGRDYTMWDLVKDEVSVPSSISDLLIARIDRLSSELKEMTQAASVVGREFDYVLLLSVLQRINKELEMTRFKTYLNIGQQENIWRTVGHVKYAFTHSMMQSAVYQMQLKQQVRELHRMVAEAIELFYLNDKQAYADLAFHYDRAENREKAMEYLFKAAETAKHNYENEKALEFYSRLIEYHEAEYDGATDNIPGVTDSEDAHQDSDRSYINLLTEKGKLFQKMGRWEEADQILKRACDLAVKSGNQRRMGKTYLNYGMIKLHKGDYDNAQKYLKLAQESSQKANDDYNLVTIIGNIGVLHAYQGKMEEAIQYFNQQLELAEKTHKKEGISFAVGNLGIIYDQLGQFEQAMSFYQRKLDLAQEMNDKTQIVNVTMNIGAAYLTQGQYGSAMEYLERSLELAQTIGDKQGIVEALLNIGLIEYELGKFSLAMKRLGDCLRLTDELGARLHKAFALTTLGRTYKDTRSYPQAELHLNQAIDLWKNLGARYYMAQALVEKAELLFIQNQYDEATTLVQDGLEHAQQTGYAEYVFKANLLYHRIRYQLGDVTGAISALQAMLHGNLSEQDRADLAFVLWEMTGEEDFRETATDIYRKLYDVTPKSYYKKRLKQLT